jgi:hypothetical protein
MSKPREAYSVETFDCLNCNNVHIFLKDERDLVFATAVLSATCVDHIVALQMQIENRQRRQ